MASDRLMWHRLNDGERHTLMVVAALHRELGAEAKFDTAAVELIASSPVVAELGLLVQFGLLERFPEDGGRFAYRLTGEGFMVMPDSEERRALDEHRESAAQDLMEGKDGGQ